MSYTFEKNKGMYFHTIIVFLSDMAEGMNKVHGFTVKHNPIAVERFSHNFNGAPCISYNFTCLGGPEDDRARGGLGVEVTGGKLECLNKPLTELEENIYKALTAWRNELLEKAKGRRNFVASNAELRSIAVFQPRLKEHLMLIRGFAKDKTEKYGDEILSIVGKFLPSTGNEELGSVPWPSDEIMNSVWPDGKWVRPILVAGNAEEAQKEADSANGEGSGGSADTTKSTSSADSNGASGTFEPKGEQELLGEGQIPF